MPVWHAATKKWVEEGRLVVLGVTQEQHPNRCRLFAQWQQFDWPILHDPINVLGLKLVAVLVAIDEHGIVRSTGPSLENFETEFLDRNFNDEDEPTPDSLTPSRDFAKLQRLAEKDPTADNWRALADSLAIWGGSQVIDKAIDAYGSSLDLNAEQPNVHFRLGVCLRTRHESAVGQPGDFSKAVKAWETALAERPDQYIWRRRIQQYGPRMIKPYPFYDWVAQARQAITARGAEPVLLAIEPSGAELAKPAQQAATKEKHLESPDPKGAIQRDSKPLVATQVTVVPSSVPAGQSARVHVTFVPNADVAAHWNNESEPLRTWIEVPENWQVSKQLLSAPQGDQPETDEIRRLDFDIHIPASATGKQLVKAYALYYVCEGASGTCQFLRQDIPVEINVTGSK